MPLIHFLHGFLHTITGGLDCLIFAFILLPYTIYKYIKWRKSDKSMGFWKYLITLRCKCHKHNHDAKAKCDKKSCKKNKKLGLIAVFIFVVLIVISYILIKKEGKMVDLKVKDVVWKFDRDLSFYNDDKLLEEMKADAVAFEKKYKGKLNTKLGDALTDYIEMEKKSNSLFSDLWLRQLVDLGNEELDKSFSKISEFSAREISPHTIFFNHELAKVSDADYKKMLKTDKVVAHHKSMIDRSRENAKYLLDENVELSLALRSPFFGGEWGDFIENEQSDLRFNIDGEKIGLTQALEKTSEEKDAKKRREYLKEINSVFKSEKYDKLSARVLNYIIGLKSVSDKQRGYEYPMQTRNISNMVSKETVEALHKAGETKGLELSKRFYKLKAEVLGLDKLYWADRNAKMPFVENDKIPYTESVEIVRKSFGDFSPKMLEKADVVFDNGWVDAPHHDKKRSGALSISFYTKEGPESYVFLNYLGSKRDVSTLAHEMGHSVHGLFAMEKQGPLMLHAPLAYAEVGSTFAERIVFEDLLKKETDKKKKFAMLMSKLDDSMNTIVRQLSFSDFEQQIHEKRKAGKLTVQEFNDAWLDSTRKYYGEDGDVFVYEDMDSLWAYISHFRRPFYVYAYAFAELFSTSIYAVKDNYENFEEMYFDVLRAGDTKTAVELLKPFGLDPRDENFWVNGFEVGVEKVLDEAERLWEEIK